MSHLSTLYPHSLRCKGTQSHTLTHNYHLKLSYSRRSVSDLAQVLNVTSSQLCNVSSSVDTSIESASFAERLDESFAFLIEPYRYTSYEISSSLRPTTMIFGCPLPDELDGASIGQRAVSNAFEMILSSTAKKYPVWKAMCDGHKRQGDNIKLVSTSIWTCIQFLLMSPFIVSTPTGIIMGLISAKWWSRSC